MQKKIIMIKKPFTLLELSVVLLVVTILSTILVSLALPVVQGSTTWRLNQKIQNIEYAIIGNPAIRDVDGSIVPNGYFNDIGAFPDPYGTSLDYSFHQLIERLPNSIPESDNYALIDMPGKMTAGWNGAYLIEASYEELKNIIQLEIVDDDIDGKDDLRIFASAYPDLDRYIYGKDMFKKRYITIKGFTPGTEVNVIINYVKDGEITDETQVFSDIYGDTTIDLPMGVCAFFAELIEDHTIPKFVPSPPLTDEGDVFVQTSSSPITGNRHSWNGSIYVPDPFSLMTNEVLFNEESSTYYLYNGTDWGNSSIPGKTAIVTKTVKTDILLELE